MAEIPNVQVEGFTDGGSAEGGTEIWIQLNLSGNQTVRFYIHRDVYPLLLQGLMHFGGMATAEYLKRNSQAEIVGAFAPKIRAVSCGISLSEEKMAVMSFEVGEPKPVQISFSATQKGLGNIIEVAQTALTELEKPNPPASSKRKH